MYHYSSAKVLFIDKFSDLLKNIDEYSITVPSKCIKVVRNNNWSERKKQVIIQQCTENSNVIHGATSSSVSVVAD